MKWKNLWYKFKKNQNKIGRCISIFLTVLLVIAVGAAVIHIRRTDIANAANTTEVEKESPIEENKDRDYGEPGLKIVAQNDAMILYADTTNGEIAVEEKANGKIWYSNPQDRDTDEIAPLKSRLNSQLNITCLTIPDPTETRSTLKYAEITADSANGSVALGGLDYELITDGIKFIYSFPNQGIRIPVRYLLTEDGFAAEIIMNEVEELWMDRYVLLNIDFLPFFGAGGLEDEGYLFVPDGSGALIHFNNGKQRFMQYSSPVYGTDYVTSSTSAPANTEQIALPVFGLKCNENAFLAVITSGDALGQITALPSRKLSSYNQVYSRAIYRTYSKRAGDDKIAIQNKNISVAQYTEPMLDGVYRVDFYMLDGEDANYSGMASRYRSLLLEDGMLGESELAEKPYFMVNLYGAVSIEKYVMGIKKQVVTALTGYEDVTEIVRTLKENGIENIIVNYIGAMDGGLDAEPMNYFDVESALGSRQDFEEMKDYLEQEGVILFIESDPVNLHEDGNGYEVNRDASVSFYDSYSFQYQYSLNLNRALEQTRWSLLKPSLLPKITGEFFESAVRSGLTNYSAASIGSTLYSDYNQDAPTYRQDSLSIWQEVLSEAAGIFDYVMVEGGNAYTFPYVDVIRNVSFEFSDYDITDESIPFYQMVLRGNIAMGAPSFNLEADYHYYYLKALETGCNLSYTWIAGDVISLVDTEYNDLVSTSFDYWIDTAIQEYQDSIDLMNLTAGKQITGHRKLAEEVFETTYEGNIRVYVNYSDETYRYGEISIEPRSFAYAQ